MGPNWQLYVFMEAVKGSRQAREAVPWCGSFAWQKPYFREKVV